MQNPSLRAAPRDQKAPIIESTVDTSILHWLEGTGRLMERNDSTTKEEEELVPLTGLSGSDDEEEEDDIDLDDGDDDEDDED